MPVYLVGYAERMLYSEEPTVLLARRHLYTMTNFENLNSISNIFQETRDFLVLTDPLIIFIYLNHRQTFSWPRKRPSSHLKVNKMWFGPNIKYLSEPFFAYFYCREGISCWLWATMIWMQSLREFEAAREINHF